MTDRPVHTRKTMERLFARFSVIYGNLWSSQFQSEELLELALKEWSITLGPYSTRRLQAALDVCKKHYPMPPTLQQFAAVCRKAPPHKSVPCLPPAPLSPADKQTALEHIAKCREILVRAGR